MCKTLNGDISHSTVVGLTWDRCTECHKHHSGDRVLEADGAAEVRRQVPDDRREQADDDDGDDETGPAVHVVCGRDASKQDLPEDGEEVHDVVETGRQPFFSCVLFVLIFWVEVGPSGRGKRRGSRGCERWDGLKHYEMRKESRAADRMKR